MKCPIDDSPLSVSSREGVEIDFCPQCRGVWLDRGELDKIIDRAANVARARRRPPPPRRSRAASTTTAIATTAAIDGDRRKRKKRSFLDDLFDFD